MPAFNFNPNPTLFTATHTLREDHLCTVTSTAPAETTAAVVTTFPLLGFNVSTTVILSVRDNDGCKSDDEVPRTPPRFYHAAGEHHLARRRKRAVRGSGTISASGLGMYPYPYG